MPPLPLPRPKNEDPPLMVLVWRKAVVMVDCWPLLLPRLVVAVTAAVIVVVAVMVWLPREEEEEKGLPRGWK